MSPFSVTVLAVSMSVDAFAVSVGRGAALGRPRVGEALRTGAVFGIVEAITPVIGWLAGLAASGFIEAVDHWIAFALLAAVGLHMLYAASRPADASADAAKAGRSFTVLLATAIGTSLDAMAVGVSLALLDVEIVTVAIAIGLATFLMSSGGMLIGRLVGARLGRIAEAVAGAALIALGLSILYQHIGG